MPDASIESVEHRFHTHLNDRTLPLTLVALHDGKPIGAVSLRDNDGIRPDLTPWLGSLIVDAAYQHRGIGKNLVDALKQKAIELHFKKLYLFAFDPTIPDYYQRLGFNKIGMEKFKEYVVTVMETTL